MIKKIQSKNMGLCQKEDKTSYLLKFFHYSSDFSPLLVFLFTFRLQ